MMTTSWALDNLADSANDLAFQLATARVVGSAASAVGAAVDPRQRVLRRGACGLWSPE